MLDLRDCDCEYVRARCVLLGRVLVDVPPVRVIIELDNEDEDAEDIRNRTEEE